MNPRHVIYALLLVFALGAQWTLWFGKGGIFHQRELERNLQVLQENNERLRDANAAVFEEIESLSSGAAAVEEHARYEFGMIRRDEVLVRLVPKSLNALPLRRDSVGSNRTGRIFKPKHGDLYTPGDTVQENGKTITRQKSKH